MKKDKTNASGGRSPRRQVKVDVSKWNNRNV